MRTPLAIVEPLPPEPEAELPGHWYTFGKGRQHWIARAMSWHGAYAEQDRLVTWTAATKAEAIESAKADAKYLGREFVVWLRNPPPRELTQVQFNQQNISKLVRRNRMHEDSAFRAEELGRWAEAAIDWIKSVGALADLMAIWSGRTEHLKKCIAWRRGKVDECLAKLDTETQAARRHGLFAVTER